MNRIELREKICEIFNNIKNSYKNYSVTLLTIVLLTVFESVMFMLYMEFDINIPFDDEVIARVLLIFGVEAAFIETYFRENGRGKIKIPAFLVSAVIAGIAAMGLGLKNSDQIMQLSGALIKDITSRLLGGYLLLLLIGIVYYSFKRSGMVFEEYSLRLFSNLMKVSLFYFTLLMGALMVAGIVDILFLERGGSMSFVAAVMVTGLYFAPKCISSLEDMDDEPGALLKSLVKYVLACITICAMVVVYFYMLKIIIMRQIPSNEIFSIVSSLFCLGMPIWLITEYYSDETKYSKILRALPYVFAPMILLQIYSMGIRIYEHGMTPERYMGLMLIVFEAAAILIWHFCKNHYEVMLKFLAVLIVISVFVPVVNMESVSNIWQRSFLQKYYQRVLDGKELSELEYERMIGAHDYLRYNSRMKEVAEKYDVYDEDFVKLLGEEEYETDKLNHSDSYYIHCCQMTGDIDINGYNQFSMLNQADIYDNLSSRDENGEEKSVDFSRFKFIVRETGEEVVVDISDFATRCMDYKKEHSDADKDDMSKEMRKYNRIDISDDITLFINHFEVRYSEGMKEGENYFRWTSVNLGGMLLKK